MVCFVIRGQIRKLGNSRAKDVRGSSYADVRRIVTVVLSKWNRAYEAVTHVRIESVQSIVFELCAARGTFRVCRPRKLLFYFSVGGRELPDD